MEIVRHEDYCEVKQANSSKTVRAEIMEFREQDKLTVVLNKKEEMVNQPSKHNSP